MESVGYSVRPMGPLDAEALLADMHLHSLDFHDKARAEFEEVLKAQPDNVAALRGLGYSYLTERDFAQAAEYFRRAIEHDSQDPRVLYYSALMIELQEGPGLGNDQQELDVIQKRLEKAVELDPEFADAYCRLAFTYVSQGKRELALAAMMKAMSLNPRSQAYALNLAEMYLFNGKVDQALALLEPLEPAIEPRFAVQSAQLLDRARSLKQRAASGTQVAAQSGAGDEALAGLREPAVPGEKEIADSEAVPKTPTSARFLKGKLMAVDCSVKPEAVFTVISGSTTWKFHARDSTRVIVIGAENLSCDWSNRRVAINYQQTGEGTGEVISVELQ
jgi:Flp pilus assembly protein TadD